MVSVCMCVYMCVCVYDGGFSKTRAAELSGGITMETELFGLLCFRESPVM